VDWVNGIENWLGEWGSTIAGTSLSVVVCSIILYAMTYGFLWFLLPLVKRMGGKSIKLPFKIEIELDNSLAHILAQTASDNIIEEGINEVGNKIEQRTRQAMRGVLNRIIQQYIKDNPNNTDYHSYFLMARAILADIIADNHIVYSLTKDRLENYVETKQTQVLSGIWGNLDGDDEIKGVLNNLVSHFVCHILPIQRTMCLDKISAYERAMEQLQLEHSRAICQGKITKNKDYITNIDTVIDNFGLHSGVLSATSSQILKKQLSGAELLEQRVKTTMGIIKNDVDSNYTFLKELKL
jgi:hypothetical protein